MRSPNQATAQKPLFIVNFPKWWKTEKFNIILMFSDIWNGWQIYCSPSVKLKKNTQFITCYPAMPMNSLFSWKFFYSFPVCANAKFSQCFATNYWRLMSWKHDICRLFSCSTKTLVYSLFSWTFFYSFPERANAAFSKRFPTELSTVNAMKRWCLLIVFLLHENASVQLFSWTFFYSFPKRANAAFSKCFPHLRRLS